LQRNKLQTYAHLPVPLPWTKVGPFALALTPRQSDRREELIRIFDTLDDQGKQELLRLAKELAQPR
jgi:hypothetical protein